MVCTVFLGLLLTSSFSIIHTTFAPTPGLTLKWEAKLGPYAQTYIAPLAVNVNGRTEIITTGSNQDYGTAGLVTALDGKTGNIIWQVRPGGIGSHTPFEIADINNDGVPEIVISAQGGALCLFANNGSTYWKNRNAPAEENYPAIADVNNDGYDEVFVSRGNGPYNGYDYITELSYNGTILHQAYVWHPCWGGLTVGDPNFNGQFMLFVGDRSYAYDDPSDPYQHGGMGIRALDAATLTPLWNDSDILCSSQAPMLADVDKDGKLDVVVAWQPNGGMAVLNATDGTILQTNGIYRANSSLGLWDHSNPTIGQFDSSGDMESITAQVSQPKIFDLYTWQLVATLPIKCQEPPKAGHVTADGALDIIAISGVNDTSTIFEYNNAINQFESVQNITGLLHANAFSLVQDVDGDGLNELVLTSGDGNVFCYDTPATASTPPVRTGYQFFSDRHDGVAEYAPPAGPNAPQIYQPLPQDNATNVPTITSQLSFKLRDYQGDHINYTVTTSPNVGGGGPINVYNATFPTLPTRCTVPVSGLQSNTIYTWTVAATDGQNANSQTYSFTTGTPSVQSLWKLTVASAHDSPNPAVGDNLFSNGSSVTCSVTSPVVENNVSYTCTGWTGTGSVPPTGSAASTTFTMTQNSTITWNWNVTPLGTGKVTGGGQCIVGDNEGLHSASFSFNAMWFSRDRSPKGELNYVDHITGMHVHIHELTYLQVWQDLQGNKPWPLMKAIFGGPCTINGKEGFFAEVYVEDNGEPGTKDKFQITLSTGYVGGSDTVAILVGNIQIQSARTEFFSSKTVFSEPFKTETVLEKVEWFQKKPFRVLKSLVES